MPIALEQFGAFRRLGFQRLDLLIALPDDLLELLVGHGALRYIAEGLELLQVLFKRWASGELGWIAQPVDAGR
jgi:hypothetical protein